MLFNSPEFIFAFFPATIAIFFLIGRVSREWSLSWLIFASLFFYAWWNPINVLIIGPSLIINYVLARVIQYFARDDRAAAKRRAVLIAGIAFNVLFLGYFKYVNFLEASLNDLIGTQFVLTQVILPLGISFIAFQKIAFLIDVNAGQIKSFSFREFGLFVLFFPQLIAGPIVHFRETMPQFRSGEGRFNRLGFSVGLTLFSIGLFKKVVLADGIAVHISPIYDLAAGGESISLFGAWAAAVGFTLQIYFDFSGYSDMALGLARCFGIRLPLNFDSPLKASSIIDFWLRWHVTLTRFLTAYIYNPLALWLTRRRMSRRLPLLGGRRATVGAFLQLLAMPTIITMAVSGLWHGAGYLFILWGLLHGVYLTINHAWRIWAAKAFPVKEKYDRVMRPAGFLLTFLAVAFGMVLFRSTSVAGASDILAGMLGLNGIALPAGLVEPFGLAGALEPFVTLEPGGATAFVLTNLWVAGLFLIATLLPNSLQVTALFEPALDFAERPGHTAWRASFLSWRPTVVWGIAIAVLAILAISNLGAKSEFLYWQF